MLIWFCMSLFLVPPPYLMPLECLLYESTDSTEFTALTYEVSTNDCCIISIKHGVEYINEWD